MNCKRAADYWPVPNSTNAQRRHGSQARRKTGHHGWAVGDTVACRTTSEGTEVLAVGWEEVGRFFEETPSENRQGVMIRHT